MIKENVLRVENERYTIFDSGIDDVILSVTHLKPLQSTLGHKHNWGEIYYVSDGSGRMRLGKTSFNVNRGRFVVVPPNTFHRLYNLDKGSPLVVVCSWREFEDDK